MAMAPSTSSDNTNTTLMMYDSSTSVYSVFFEGTNIETTVTNKAIIVDKWVQQVSSTHVAGTLMIVGLDTEWMTIDVVEEGEKKRKNKTAILQLCVEEKCLIFQFNHMDYIPFALHSFMTNSEFKFVGVGVKEDTKMLLNDHWLMCNNGIDVATLATRQWPGRFNSSPGLQLLAKELANLNMKKPKDVTMSKWESRELTRAQIEYACIDAFASYKIGKKLLIDEGLALTLPK